jgi:hypothetical protein
MLPLMAITKHRGASGPFTATAYKNGNGSSSVNAVTVSGISTVGGETVLVFGASHVTTWATTPVTDSGSHTYTSVYSVASTTSTVARQLCYALQNAASGITSVTVTKSATDTNPFDVVVIVVTGAIAASLDVHVAVGSSSASTSLASGASAGSIVAVNEAVFGAGSSSNDAASPTWSAQTFAGTAALYTGQAHLATQTDGASTTWSSLDVSWINVSGSTEGTISFAEICSQSSGWCCGAVSLRSV